MKSAPAAGDVFEEKLAAAAKLLEPKLRASLPTEGRLAEAMRYAVLGNGKRFRPFLVLESTELFGAPKASALDTAVAIEYLHCYSLVHDDLPAMDDDDTRRGKPAVHKAFDEATAILAGDALLTLAFEIMTRPQTHPDPNIRSELTLGLAKAAGWAGMAGGQQLDMEAEMASQNMEGLERIQRMKTGALIQFSAEAGAIIAGASEEHHRAIQTYAEKLGLAYDLRDQLMDARQDAKAGKATVVSLIGEEGTQARLELAVREALEMLEEIDADTTALREAAKFTLHWRT